jgi:hypothetical protein
MKKYEFDPQWDNTPVQKIGLKEWCEDNRLKEGDTFKYNGETHTINGLNYDYHNDATLNETQVKHMADELNLYDSVETCKEKWFHKGNIYYPIEETRVPDQLPPIYIQWKDEYRKRHVRKKR